MKMNSIIVPASISCYAHACLFSSSLASKQAGWQEGSLCASVTCFGFKPNEQGETINTDEPVCRICSKVVATKKGNTTNLHAHLKQNHPTQFSQLGKKLQLEMQSLRPDSQHSLRRWATWCVLTESVVRYNAKEMLPFNTVEKPAFGEMLQTFDRQHELPVRK